MYVTSPSFCVISLPENYLTQSHIILTPKWIVGLLQDHGFLGNRERIIPGNSNCTSWAIKHHFILILLDTWISTKPREQDSLPNTLNISQKAISTFFLLPLSFKCFHLLTKSFYSIRGDTEERRWPEGHISNPQTGKNKIWLDKMYQWQVPHKYQYWGMLYSHHWAEQIRILHL